MEITHADILVVATIAAMAPILADLSRRVRVPIVVAEIALGIIVGPELLDLASTDDFVESLSTFGLAFLFFLAGIEIDFERIRGAPTRLGVGGWVVSLALGLGIAVALWAAGAIDAPILVGLALTTTALGTLMPILRDSGVLDERFGKYVLGAGAAGEFGPVVIVSIILAVEAGEPWRTTLLFVFAALVVGATLLALRAQPARMVRLIETTMGTSGQLAVRLSVLLVIAMVALASEFSLDVILGAFAAGIIVGLVIRDRDAQEFEAKLDALGYGFLIPIFFIATGMDYDVDALLSSPTAIALVPGFALLFLIVRGLPVRLLYRGELDRPERLTLALFSASALPLVVAITEIGTEVGVMREEEASALVGAAMLSILLFPLLALWLRRRGG
ncbi:MAG: sodium:proton exchanger [Solirubrobacterales bacterium]|nr:sodium:proton exchanger [Solirubrobacterales bacterium]